jgi:hypothetical protein
LGQGIPHYRYAGLPGALFIHTPGQYQNTNQPFADRQDSRPTCPGSLHLESGPKTSLHRISDGPPHTGPFPIPLSDSRLTHATLQMHVNKWSNWSSLSKMVSKTKGNHVKLQSALGAHCPPGVRHVEVGVESCTASLARPASTPMNQGLTLNSTIYHLIVPYPLHPPPSNL